MEIGPGEIVVVVLHTPREKLLGVLREIGPAGIAVRSIDLGYFDDWCRAVAADEPHLDMSENFFPMWRVERLTMDEGSASIPSLREQFRTRTGQELTEQ